MVLCVLEAQISEPLRKEVGGSFLEKPGSFSLLEAGRFDRLWPLTEDQGIFGKAL